MLFGEYPRQSQQSYLEAYLQVAAKGVTFRNLQTLERLENGVWAVDDSVETRSAVYNRLQFEVRYWPDREDASGKAELTMEETD